MEQAQTSKVIAIKSPTRLAAWGSAVGATVGILFSVVVALNVLALFIRFLPQLFPPAETRTAHAIVMFMATGSALGEGVAVVILWRILLRRGDSLARLGLWQKAPWFAWLAGLAVAAYYVMPAVNGLHLGAAHLPIHQILFDPSLFHIYTALLLGIGSGVCEEVFFRGFIMTRLADAGYGAVVQVIASGVFFGFAHGLYAISNGPAAGLDIMLHTALLGGLYAIVYLMSRRSLMPCIVSHLINDAIVLPWTFLQIFHGH